MTKTERERFEKCCGYLGQKVGVLTIKRSIHKTIHEIILGTQRRQIPLQCVLVINGHVTSGTKADWSTPSSNGGVRGPKIREIVD